MPILIYDKSNAIKQIRREKYDFIKGKYVDWHDTRTIDDRKT